MFKISDQLKALLLRLTLIQKNKDSETIDFEIKNSPVIFSNGTKVNFKTFFDADTHERLEKIQPDAVYHFDKEPLMLFFDLKQNDKRNIEIIKKQSYNFDKPVIFILEFGKPLAIFNAFSYSQKSGKFDLDKIADVDLDKIEKDENIEKFSFWNLQSGNTWQWFNKLFASKSKNRVHTQLLKNIANLRTKYKAIPHIDILILRLIFFRYLVDRKVRIKEFFIYGDPNDQQRLAAIIRSPKELHNAFEYLKGHFNGNLFEQVIDLQLMPLESLAVMFAGKIDEQGNFQDTLFDIFDFSIIPIETISGIYEEIISDDKKKDNSAVYTPLFLVNYILDKTINKDYFDTNKGTNCKVLDPACGSGIFLVQAFRRMVNWEKNYGDKNITKSIKKLNALVEQNIFGIDRDETALNVAVFSLYIAILDFKTPKEISESKQQLPELIGKNLFEADFFDSKDKFNYRFGNKQYQNSLLPPKQEIPTAIKPIELDFIIGNPPWSNETGTFHKNYMKFVENEVKISGNQIAQSFLWHAKDFVNENKATQIAFIVTSTAFYNLAAKDFRTKFFKNFAIKWLFDMSAARRLAFEGRTDNPAMILLYQYAQNEVKCGENVLQYEALKPNVFIKNFNKIVIDVARNVKQSFLIENDFMLKVLLYGDVLDYYFLKRLSKFPIILKKFLAKKAKCGRGFPNSDKVELQQISEIYTHITEQTKENAILYLSEIDKKKKSKKNTLIRGSKILLKRMTKDESRLFVSYTKDDCFYDDNFCGIVSTKFDLKDIFGLIMSDVYTYYQFIIGSDWDTATRPRISLTEYLSFPLSDKIVDNNQLINFVNSIIASLESYDSNNNALKGNRPTFNELRKQDKLIQINQLINETYQISPTEKDLIDYVLDVARYEFQEGKIDTFVTKKLSLSSKADEDYLKNYAQIFYNHFGQVYNSDREYFQIKIFVFEYFVAMQFCIVSEKPTQENQIIFNTENNDISSFLNRLASNLTIYEISEDVFMQQNLRGSEEDFFYLIKPNQLKSWHRAKARTDLMGFIEEINKAELELYG